MAPGCRVQVVHGPESLRPVPVLPMKLTDFLGKEYGPGDLVIYAAHSGRCVNMVIGRVVDVYQVWHNCYTLGERYGWERIPDWIDEELADALEGQKVATRVKIQPLRGARWEQHYTPRAVTIEITGNIVKWEGELPGEVPDEVP